MTWGFRREVPITREQYDQLDKEITKDPDGLILHSAAPTDGGFQIIDVWDSKEAYERFERETLFPAFERIGVSMKSPPPRHDFDVHKVRGRGARA